MKSDDDLLRVIDDNSYPWIDIFLPSDLNSFSQYEQIVSLEYKLFSQICFHRSTKAAKNQNLWVKS